MNEFQLDTHQQNFLKAHSNLLKVDKAEWYYMPFWFRKLKPGIFERVNFENLPEEVKNEIKQLRHEESK